MPKYRRRNVLKALAGSLSSTVGLILVWRGIWYLLDWIDSRFLGGTHLWSVAIGIVAGAFLLNLPARYFHRKPQDGSGSVAQRSSAHQAALPTGGSALPPAVSSVAHSPDREKDAPAS